MKPALRPLLGIALASLGTLYLIGTAPVLPAWAWGLVGAAVLFGLHLLGAPEEAVGVGAAFAGWALGALAADLTGLQSLKLVGTGLGIGIWGWHEEHETAAWAGLALVAAGALAFLWESSAGTWVALAFIALGAYLVLQRGDAPNEGEGPQARTDAGVFSRLARWRNREAERLGTINTSVLSDAELGCLAALPRPPSPEAVAGCLKDHPERLDEVLRALKEDV